MKDYYILFGICFYIFVLGKILVTIIPGNEIANALLFLTAVLVGAMYYFQNKKTNNTINIRIQITTNRRNEYGY